MKTIIVSFLVMIASVGARAMVALPTGTNKLFDLMKCTSMKNGTVWASYGHVITSANPEPQFFATEIVVIENEGISRLYYSSDFKKSMSESPARVTPGSGSLTFQVDIGGVTRTHSLTWILSDLRNPNGFYGNWRVSEPGKEEVNDFLACTLN